MQRIGALVLLGCFCGHAAAFVGVSPSLATRGMAQRSALQCAPQLRTPQPAALSMMADGVDEKDLIKVFGRIAEKTLFGDGSAGACCHSGCDNCEWRYSFDVLQSARPKWIPCYSSNKFEDGREHVAKWSTMFEDGEPIGKEAFAEKLAGLKFDMPLGPAGYLTAKQADLSEEVVELVWERLSKGKDSVSPKQMSMRLRKMVMPGEDGVMWSDFLVSMMGEEDEEEALGDIEEAIIVN